MLEKNLNDKYFEIFFYYYQKIRDISKRKKENRKESCDQLTQNTFY